MLKEGVALLKEGMTAMKKGCNRYKKGCGSVEGGCGSVKRGCGSTLPYKLKFNFTYKSLLMVIIAEWYSRSAQTDRLGGAIYAA